MAKGYFFKTPWWMRKLYPQRIWKIPVKEKTIYLSFDDGPHPVATPFVLDTLKKYNAKACFFCIGKNVEAEPAIYQRILAEGHSVGNHTQHHLNGWATKNSIYVKDVQMAAQNIESFLFRPPYGKLRNRQAKMLRKAFSEKKLKIIMWDVLSGDFDTAVSAQKCGEALRKNAIPGSIIVFHDSEKAWQKLQIVLPAFLEEFSKRGFLFKAIT
ncbi:MAG: polysaccharide deacetylase family protein [Chitinophagaceae bacterium]|nr:polysaccharide deacetylase family protein [Chitinophagaceae bacterium]MCB0740437.1 polysaccharide deacetylase family protein [Chitinophagaceae bacterium]